MSRRSLHALLLVGVVTLSAAAVPSHASRGVALDAASIRLPKPLHAGKTHAVRPIVVRNPGTETGRFRVGVELDGEGGRPSPDPRWIAVEAAPFELGPGGFRRMPIEIVLPESAMAGDYELLVVAELLPEAAFAVGVATLMRLQFRVAEAGRLDP